MKRKPWNRCDICGKFIPLTDFGSFLSGQPTEGPAVRRLITRRIEYERTN